MVEVNPALMLALMGQNIVGNLGTVDNELKPTAEQYALGPGDKVIMMVTDNPIDRDFTFGIIEDPEVHKDLFPDYETRVQNSFVLMRWWSTDIPEGDFGWFSRVKLLKLTEEQFTELEEYKGLPDWEHQSPPDWISDIYNRYMVELHRGQPDRVAAPVECPNCHSLNVEMHVRSSMRLSAHAGRITREGEEKHVFMHDATRSHDMDAHLHCQDCQSTAELEPEEYHLELELMVNRNPQLPHD